MKNILLFAVILSISLHSELSVTLHLANLPLTQEVINLILTRSDANSINTVRIIVTSSPQLALSTDTGSVGATPLAYAASYRYSSEVSHDAKELEYKLALGLCQILTELAPSALAISDRLGMLPIHHAARKGHSVVLEFLATNFTFTVPLRDSSGKSVLHHALLSWKNHDEQILIKIASLYPRVILDSNHPVTPFDILEFSLRNCPRSLYVNILKLAQIEKQKILQHQLATKIYQFHKTELVQQQKQQLFQQQFLQNQHNALLQAFQQLIVPPSPSAMSETTHEQEHENLSEEEEVYDEEEDDSLNSSSRDSLEEESNHANLLSERKDQDQLLQYADTLLMLQSSNSSLSSNKRQKIA